jgi:hypothetical protein
MCNVLRTISKASRLALMASIIVLLLTILASGDQLRAQEATGQETLTNADVIKMVQAHLGTDVIVSQIQNSRSKFSLTTSSLIQLKQANVPDKVIEAMQSKNSTSRPSAPAGGPSSSAKLDSGREYTVAEFERILPGILSKAAIAHGLDAQGYDKEEDFAGANMRPDHPGRDQVAWWGTEGSKSCGQASYAHMHLRDMRSEDVSMASGSVQGTPYNAHPFRPDVGLEIYEPGNRQMSDGKDFNLTLKIVAESDDRSAKFDVLLRDVQIKPLIQQDVKPLVQQGGTNAATATTANVPATGANNQDACAVVVKESRESHPKLDACIRQQAAAGEWVDWQTTRVMWTLKDNGSSIDWNGAVAYCKSLRIGGYSDWQLPTIQELQGLHDPVYSGLRGGVTVPDRGAYLWSEQKSFLKQGANVSSGAMAMPAFFYVGLGGPRQFPLDSGGSLPAPMRALCVRR